MVAKDGVRLFHALFSPDSIENQKWYSAIRFVLFVAGLLGRLFTRLV